MLKIKYPENNLGQGVKICSGLEVRPNLVAAGVVNTCPAGQAHFHEYRLENCFTAAFPAHGALSFRCLLDIDSKYRSQSQCLLHTLIHCRGLAEDVDSQRCLACMQSLC